MACGFTYDVDSLDFALATLNAAQFTCAFRLNIDLTAGGHAAGRVIASGAYSVGGWEIYRNSATAVRANIFNADTSYSYRNATIPQNVWSSYVLLAESAAQADTYFYVDGIGGYLVSGSGSRTTGLGLTTYIATNGGRDVSRDLEGFAELAVWDVPLTRGERAAYDAGMSPRGIRPGALVFYMPCVDDRFIDVVGGTTVTVAGSPSLVTHPRVSYPPTQIQRNGSLVLPPRIPEVYDLKHGGLQGARIIRRKI